MCDGGKGVVCGGIEEEWGRGRGLAYLGVGGCYVRISLMIVCDPTTNRWLRRWRGRLRERWKVSKEIEDVI